jgi:ABC-2 type transport system ATP-binding protein
VSIRVEALSRSFTVRQRRPGIVGGFKDLFGGPTQVLVALDAVSFEVNPGEIVGYIGPNGAGKSTTIKCLTGILKPTSGTVVINGLDPWCDRIEHVRNIGVVFGQRTQLWWDLAVIEAFDLLAAIYGVLDADYHARREELDALLDLGDLLHKPVRELSLGQRMRCDLAASLLHAPSVVLLDEPTIGLDITVKKRVRSFIRSMATERGAAVFLATHDLGDIEKLCDRVLVLVGGRLVLDGRVDELASGDTPLEDVVSALYEAEEG